jgi:hypothetical protein
MNIIPPSAIVRFVMAVGLLVAPSFAQDWEQVRKQEEVRRHGALKAGSRVTLGPIDRDNWNPNQDKYVGTTTRVLELVADRDIRGCYGVRVEADGGVYFWRVRNLAGEGLRSGRYLDCLRVDDTGIPLCVIPLDDNLSLYSEPSAASEMVGKAPLYRVTESRQGWLLPRQLYVHARRDGFIEVMDSDFWSEEALGWIEESKTVQWPTRQGYVIDRARTPRSPMLGYATLEEWGQQERAVFRESMESSVTIDPNATSMCEGLLLQRRTVRGMDVVQCVITPSRGGSRKVVWLPLRRDRAELLPYVLMSKLDLIELSGNFALLYAACREGYADRIKQALEEDWDLEAKVMTGDKKRAQKYTRFYRQVQRIYPALSRRLALPPGETSEQEFQQIADRAAVSQANVQRLIDAMDRDGRDWAWVRISDL